MRAEGGDRLGVHFSRASMSIASRVVFFRHSRDAAPITTDANAFFDRSQARAWGWQDAFRDGNGATYGS
jgi:uncharacterized protein YfiM (DUF2279 family)